MEFFDDKEEVLDIQLTQYGKYLLSVGKWKPVYYSFFDDNVLYDGEFANVVESQNAIEDRIQDNTPQMHTQHVFSGRETDFLRIASARQDWWNQTEVERIRMQSTPEKEYSLSGPLGSSKVGSQQLPRWSVKLLCGNIQSVVPFLTGSFQSLQIPQVEININYKVVPQNVTDYPPGQENLSQGEAEELLSGVFPDRTFLRIVRDSLLVEVEELHTDFDVENFDIEVFKMESNKLPGTNNPTIETLNQLFFEKRKDQIQNNILVEDRPDTQVIPHDSSYVEYYFDVRVDDEIPVSVICACTNKLKSQGIYVDSEYDCPETLFEATTKSPYDVVQEVGTVGPDGAPLRTGDEEPDGTPLEPDGTPLEPRRLGDGEPDGTPDGTICDGDDPASTPSATIIDTSTDGLPDCE